MSLQTKKIGNATELSCMAAFANLGYDVLIPFGDCNRYDFVVDMKGKLIKIQCKTAKIADDNSYIFVKCRSTCNIKGHSVDKAYTKEEIDFFATFYDGKCYLIPIEECGKAAKTLRLTKTLSGQIKNINYAEDYELEKVLNAIT